MSGSNTSIRPSTSWGNTSTSPGGQVGSREFPPRCLRSTVYRVQPRPPFLRGSRRDTFALRPGFWVCIAISDFLGLTDQGLRSSSGTLAKFTAIALAESRCCAPDRDAPAPDLRRAAFAMGSDTICLATRHARTWGWPKTRRYDDSRRWTGVFARERRVVYVC
jgi:hypothetical protein